MPDETIAIPLNDPGPITVRVIALHKGKDAGDFQYLQGMRSGTLALRYGDPEQSAPATHYRAMAWRHRAMLSGAVPADFDAVISPPSRMAWQAEPYRKAIYARNPSAADLTPNLTRTGTAFAGEGATVEHVAAGLQYSPTGREGEFRRLVIVDDTFTTGTTAAAVVEILRRHGLSEDCEIIVACPLWLDTVPGNASGGSGGR